MNHAIFRSPYAARPVASGHADMGGRREQAAGAVPGRSRA